MGMFAKDELFGHAQMQKTIPAGAAFILYGIEARDDFPVENDGKKEEIRLTILTVAWPDKPLEAFKVSTLSTPIGAMVDEFEEGDVPNVCTWNTVPNKKESYSDPVVLQLYKGGDRDELLSKADPGKMKVGNEPPAH